MRKDEVPQDQGILEKYKEVVYAVDDLGRYTTVPSKGWTAKTEANELAWAGINLQIEKTRRLVLAGKLSPLAYHMELNHMKPGLLGKYVGFYRWRVRRHLKPAVFSRLSPEVLERYAKVFNITVGRLKTIDD
ncbi:MAG: hypothetical protein MUO68_20280 [Desulfobacteraceae bacterium]|jgi:hypothetical protein|nr:hypothetical protein [Desulfobacteraceae bacterium]